MIKYFSFVFKGENSTAGFGCKFWEGKVDGKSLSVVRAGARRRKRGQPFKPAHASSLDGQSSEREDRHGRRDDLQGPRLRQVPEVRFHQESRDGLVQQKSKQKAGPIVGPAFCCTEGSIIKELWKKSASCPRRGLVADYKYRRRRYNLSSLQMAFRDSALLRRAFSSSGDSLAMMQSPIP